MTITCKVPKCMLEAATHSSLLGWHNFEASVTTAFSGFLRCGEFTVQVNKSFNHSVNITRSCIQFVPFIVSPSYIIVTVPFSKMNPFLSGMSVTITSALGTPTCMVSALKGLS